MNFTYEIGTDNRLNFLDVHIENAYPDIHTSIHTKPTNPGIYLHANSECTQQYKNSSIKNLIHRTYKISSNWSVFHVSIQKLKQTIINNGYSNRTFDTLLSQYLDQRHKPIQNKTNEETHTVYYNNQYSNMYKIDERIVKHIVNSNTKCCNPTDTLKVVIYYKNKYTSNLYIKNNITKPIPKLQQTSLVYEYKCSIGDCEHQENSYIGLTTNTLSRRLTLHLSNGAPKLHTSHKHDMTLTRQMLENNTKILAKESDYNKLHILEALFIQHFKPHINKQDTGSTRTLKLFTTLNT